MTFNQRQYDAMKQLLAEMRVAHERLATELDAVWNRYYEAVYPKEDKEDAKATNRLG